MNPGLPVSGVASRPRTAEPRPIEVRDGDGRLLRMVNERSAAEIVAGDLGRWRGAREIRLNDGLRYNGFARTWYGCEKPERIRPAAYAHNQRVCERWDPALPIAQEQAGAKR
jgi:hypothetical protein